MAGMSRSVAFSIFLAALGTVSAAYAQSKDSIIWNDPPASGAQTAPKSSSAPIRDDYSTAAPPRDNSGIQWSEPSMSSKDKAGKINTSASTAGPCREFQQNIIIDGKRQKAHGTACRQPDGSWKIAN
jgi:hypothetical protein